MSTMSYSWEKETNRWDTEPDIFDEFLNEEIELENAKNSDEISIDDISDDEMELDESEFDL